VFVDQRDEDAGNGIGEQFDPVSTVGLANFSGIECCLDAVECAGPDLVVAADDAGKIDICGFDRFPGRS
jgi:hypothetical protein